MIKLFDMTSKFINRMRWKAFFYLKDMNSKDDTSTFFDSSRDFNIFPSRNSAPECALLLPFENDLWRLVKSVKFRKVGSHFQNQLKHDLNQLTTSHNIIAFADKTANLYGISPQMYKQLVSDNVTRDYKIAEENTMSNINKEAWSIIEDFKIKGKVPKYQLADAFITVKDHKEEFPRVVKCRLINPSKSHIARVSKSILDRISTDVRRMTKLTQWKNSSEVISWFNNIKHKRNKCFIAFDIVDYYPSIKKKQLSDALEFAKQFSDIDDSDIRIIMHSCKSILAYDNNIWRKKNEPDLFDIPMGSFHGAEICDIIGLYLLDKLSQIFEESMYGLYRDDGLAIVDWLPSRKLDSLRKKAISIMLEAGFKITIDVGMTQTDFLDVSLDLSNNTYKPFRKANAKLAYIHKASNHPQHIKNALPRMIERRLQSLAKNKDIFDDAKPDYDRALEKSGFRHKLTYMEHDQSAKKTRTRKRKCIFYNPPFCQSAKTNIGKSFLRLVDKHFAIDHLLHPIFNRSTVKISYCCMPNAKRIISSHNKRVLEMEERKKDGSRVKKCNCTLEDCPLNGECLTKNVVYEATVTTHKSSEIYIGSTGNTFKSRYSTHKFAFNHRGQNETALSRHIWGLKDDNITYSISWRLLNTVKGGGRSTTGTCSTCNLEKREIAMADRRKLLNKRSELNSMCPHFKKLSFKRLPKKG